MAAPVYVGDLSDGDAATAATINNRVLPLFRALNATGGGITGVTGITDDHIDDGNIAAAKITGVAMVLDTTQTATGDKTFSGSFTLTDILVLTHSAFADADTSPSISAATVFETANTGATTIDRFDDGVEGQVVFVIADDGNTTIDINTGVAGGIRTGNGVSKTLVAGEVHAFIGFDNAGTLNFNEFARSVP